MTTNEDSGVGGDDFIGHDVTGKHLLLKVPDYEDTGTGLYQSAKDTYLNLGRGAGEADRAIPSWYQATGTTPSQWGAAGLSPEVFPTAVSSGDDLLAYFGGFVDDTRLRGAGGTFEQSQATPPNEGTARAADAAPFSAVGAVAATSGTGRNLEVSQSIPEYLGWRDHTDGHRITTTRGDKIEIIGGNYKLVSLGRGTGVATYEMSGGIILDGDEPPGGVSSVTWRPCPTEAAGGSGWKVVEQVAKGHVVERFHGTKREEFYGNSLISVIGSPGDVATGTGLGTTRDDVSKNGVDEFVAITTDGIFPPTEARPTRWDEDGNDIPTLQRPTIFDSIWARGITEYKYADAITERLHCVGQHNIRAQYDSDVDSTVVMNTLGKKYVETWKMTGSAGFYEFFQGAMTQFFLGASTTIGLANRFEIFLGIEEQINVGGFFELKAGAAVEISIGPKAEIDTDAIRLWLSNRSGGVATSQATVSATTAAVTTATTAVVTSQTAVSTNITAVRVII